MAGNRAVQAIGPSYALADRKSAVQRAVNLYVTEIEGLGEDRQLILRSPLGWTPVLFGSEPARGSYVADGRWFYVSGATLFERTVEFGDVARGTLGTVSGTVSMRHNGTQLCVVDGPNGYILTLATNDFQTIASAGWLGSNDVDYLDGYFVFADPDTEKFYISAIDDGTTIDALDFSSTDSQPDNIITFRSHKRELYFFGSLSCEIWVNSGGADFPFTRYQSTPIQVGIVGQRAVCIAADSLFWVGQTDRGHGYVYQMQGYQPVRVSTQAVEEALNAAGVDLSTARMWTYHVEGNEFVGVEADGMATTWVYDAATKLWHERARWEDGDWAPLDLQFVTFWRGDHYVLTRTFIYRMDPNSQAYDHTVDYGIVRERTWPHLMAPSLEPVTYRCLELLCATGNGGRVTLEISNDGGYTFGPPLLRSLGATGRRTERVRWLGLGAANDRVFRIRTSEKVPFAIYAAAVDAA